MRFGHMRGFAACLALSLISGLTPAQATTLPASLVPDVSQGLRSVDFAAPVDWDGSALSARALWPRPWANSARFTQAFPHVPAGLVLGLNVIFDNQPPVPLDWFLPFAPGDTGREQDLSRYPFQIGWGGGRVRFATQVTIAPVPLPSGLPLLGAALAALAWPRRRRPDL